MDSENESIEPNEIIIILVKTSKFAVYVIA
jgi:hypothetical protein